MPEPMVYLLAAGQGKRAGGPKAWQLHEGRSLLERQLDFLLRRFSPDNVWVTIQQAWFERCRNLAPGVHWVSVDPEASPLASLQAVLAEAPVVAWAFFYHVDMPLWEGGLFDALEGIIAEAAADGVEAVAPSYEGRKGHPVLLSPALQKAVLALDPVQDRLDYFLRDRKERVVPVPYPCVLENWNAGA